MAKEVKVEGLSYGVRMNHMITLDSIELFEKKYIIPLYIYLWVSIIDNSFYKLKRTLWFLAFLNTDWWLLTTNYEKGVAILIGERLPSIYRKARNIPRPNTKYVISY